MSLQAMTFSPRGQEFKPEALLALHMVDAHGAAAEYREAPDRKLDSSSLVHHADRRAASRSS